MKTVTARQAQEKLAKLLKEAATSHEPIHITGRAGNGVLVSEDDWRSIEETLYLLSITGMRELILEGMQTPLSKCSTKLAW